MIRKFRLFWGMAAPPAGSAAAGNLRIDLDHCFRPRNAIPGFRDTHHERGSPTNTPGTRRGRLGLRRHSPAHHLEDHNTPFDALAGRRVDLGGRPLSAHFFGSTRARQREQRSAFRVDMDLLAGGKDSRSRRDRSHADPANRAHRSSRKKAGGRIFGRHAAMNSF